MIRTVLSLLLLACPALASANLMTMTFDGLGSMSRPYTENGITAVGSTGGLASSPGFAYVVYGAPPYSRTLDFTTGGLFTPVSVDLDPMGSSYCGGLCSEYSGEGWPDGRIPYITISGFLQNSLTGQFNFYKPRTDPWFTLALDLLGAVDLLRIDVGYDIGPDHASRVCFERCGEMLIDNLKLKAVPAPEPEMLGLLTLGALAAFVSRRRRKT